MNRGAKTLMLEDRDYNSEISGLLSTLAQLYKRRASLSNREARRAMSPHSQAVALFALERDGEWFYYPDNFSFSRAMFQEWVELVRMHSSLFPGERVRVARELQGVVRRVKRRKYDLPDWKLSLARSEFKNIQRAVVFIRAEYRRELAKTGDMDRALARVRRMLRERGGSRLATKRLWVTIAREFKATRRVRPRPLAAQLAAEAAGVPRLKRLLLSSANSQR